MTDGGHLRMNPDWVLREQVIDWWRRDAPELYDGDRYFGRLKWVVRWQDKAVIAVDPFDVDLAKAGRAVITKRGTIVRFLMHVPEATMPVVILDGDRIETFWKSGQSANSWVYLVAET